MIRFLILSSLLLLLTGCAETGARWLTYGAELEIAAVNMVRENGEIRRDIRRLCRERLWERIKRLDEAGKEDEADRLLDANYPAPLTMQLVRAYRDDEAGGFTMLSHPWGCRAALVPMPNPETGLLDDIVVE